MKSSGTKMSDLKDWLYEKDKDTVSKIMSEIDSPVFLDATLNLRDAIFEFLTAQVNTEKLKSEDEFDLVANALYTKYLDTMIRIGI